MEPDLQIRQMRGTEEIIGAWDWGEGIDVLSVTGTKTVETEK